MKSYIISHSYHPSNFSHAVGERYAPQATDRGGSLSRFTFHHPPQGDSPRNLLPPPAPPVPARRHRHSSSSLTQIRSLAARPGAPSSKCVGTGQGFPPCRHPHLAHPQTCTPFPVPPSQPRGCLIFRAASRFATRTPRVPTHCGAAPSTYRNASNPCSNKVSLTSPVAA